MPSSGAHVCGLLLVMTLDEIKPGLAPCYCCGLPPTFCRSLWLPPCPASAQRLQEPEADGLPQGCALVRMEPGLAGEGVWKGRNRCKSHQKVPFTSGQTLSEHCLRQTSLSSSLSFSFLSFSKSPYESFCRLESLRQCMAFQLDLISLSVITCVSEIPCFWGPIYLLGVWADFVIDLTVIFGTKE